MPLKVTAGGPIVLAFLGLCAIATAQAQGSSTSRGTAPATPSPGISTDRMDITNGASSMDSSFNEPQSLRAMRQNARRDDLKKRMEQNATRLLQLTAELRNDLQSREPTEADGKRLDEIAKLAHAVREQMKQ